ncbi:hypothetical protein GALL_378980 [mine drainage metagenome]|jgi:hypothetical protein|uniref:ATPase with chaperone activity n=1 Tax=mine drainage metagenome TaxID=410659 RepID=A0A1J5QAY5_9ZZZZ
MHDESQLESQITVPPSFIALFIEPGRSRPSASRAHIAQRYDLCEDLANLLTEQASTIKWELGVTEHDVLERVLRGLLAGPAAEAAAAVDVVDAREARWVVTRLAELLGWPALPTPPQETRDEA